MKLHFKTHQLSVGSLVVIFSIAVKVSTQTTRSVPIRPRNGHLDVATTVPVDLQLETCLQCLSNVKRVKALNRLLPVKQFVSVTRGMLVMSTEMRKGYHINYDERDNQINDELQPGHAQMQHIHSDFQAMTLTIHFKRSSKDKTLTTAIPELEILTPSESMTGKVAMEPLIRTSPPRSKEYTESPRWKVTSLV